MFFDLSKFLIHLERPGDLLLLLLTVGAGLAWSVRYRRAGIMLVLGVTLIFLFIAAFPVGSWVAAPLENRFPRPRSLPAHIDGLIVLGGAIDPGVTAIRKIPTLGGDADRMTEFVRLAKLHPEARLVFSGGSGLGAVPPDQTEASAARLFFREQGLDVTHMVFEARSRDTYENVLFTKPVVKPHPGEVWVLVASAEDVPRSVGVFRKQGWPVIAMPVAYKSDYLGGGSFAANLNRLDNAVHEWLGLIAYRMTGRTDVLFPSPGRP
jgi:uncharacterized SAM-binding protein YcdF (DUF218 family)